MKLKLSLEGNITLKGLKSNPKVIDTKIFSVYNQNLNNSFIDSFNEALIAKKNELLKKNNYKEYKIKTLKLDNVNSVYTAKLIFKEKDTTTTYSYYVSSYIDGNVYIGYFKNDFNTLNKAIMSELFNYLVLLSIKVQKSPHLISNNFSIEFDTVDTNVFELQRDKELDQELKDIKSLKYMTRESYPKIDDLIFTKICQIIDKADYKEVFHTLYYTNVSNNIVLYAKLKHTYHSIILYSDWDYIFSTIYKQYKDKYI